MKIDYHGNEVDDSNGLPPESGKQQNNVSNGVVASFYNTTPFNNYTNQIRVTIDGTVIKDLKRDGVVGSLLTTKNYYYQAWGLFNLKGKVSGGYIHGADIKKHGQKGGKARVYNEDLANLIPYYCLLPNCVGGARGRYQELSPDGTKSFPDANPPGYWKKAQFPTARTEPYEGFKKVANGFYLWEDTDGKYGPKGGLWGKGRAKDGYPPVPGAMITWRNKNNYTEGHIEFIEAVYNFGTDDEYIMTTSSAFANYTYNVIGVLSLCKRTKYGFTKTGSNLYGWDSGYDETTFLYTPLCGFDSMGGALFNYFDLTKIPSNPDQASAQEEAYETLIEMGTVPALSDKVEILWFGNTKKDGSGSDVNRNGGIGWIKKIYDSGYSNPYEVVDAPKGGTRIGFFEGRWLRRITDN